MPDINPGGYGRRHPRQWRPGEWEQWTFLLLQRSCFDFAQHKPGQQHCPAQAGWRPGLHLLPAVRRLPRRGAQPDNYRPGLYRAAAEPGGGAAVLPGALLFNRRGPQSALHLRPAVCAMIEAMTTQFIERHGRLEELDRSFDLAFWQSQPPAARFAAVWELVLHAHKVKGRDVRQLRLQRSAESFQRQRR